MSNEAMKPQGMRLQEGLPATAEELVSMATAMGVEVGKNSNFGFRSVDHSSPVPVVAEGDPIVDAAAGLRARKRGEIAIGSHGVVTRSGKELLEKVAKKKIMDSDST